MAEAASNVPTFKLVLVGDGGTGKVWTQGLGRSASSYISLRGLPCRKQDTDIR